MKSMSSITSIFFWDLWRLWTSLSGCRNQHYPNHWSLSEIACVCESCEVENKLHVYSTTGLPVLFGSDACFQDPASRAGMPSNLNPASKEMISDSVELCETEVCFLHIQLIGTNVWLPKTHNVPPEVDFESSRSPAKSESWNSPSLHCLAVFPTWQYCLYSHVWWMYEINRFKRLSQALVHFVIDRAILFTDHKYRVVQFLPVINISEQFESIHVTIVQQISFFFFEVVVIDAWSRYFVELLRRLVGQLTISFHTLLCMTSHVIRPSKKYEDFEGMVISLLPRGNSRFEHGSVIVHNFFLIWHCRWVQPKYTWSTKDVGSPKSTSLLVLSTSDQDFVSFQPIWCHPHTQIRIILFHDVQRDIPNLEFSPSHVSIGFSQIAFPIIVLPKDDHTDCVQEEQLGLPYWTMILATCVVVDESIATSHWTKLS